MEKLYIWDNKNDYRVISYESNSNVIVTDEYFETKDEALDRLDELTEWDADIIVYQKFNSIPVEEHIYNGQEEDEEEKEISEYQVNPKLYSTLNMLNSEIKKVDTKLNEAFVQNLDAIDILEMKMEALLKLRLSKFGV